MKVDGNYKYDVMEGFEPLNMSRRMTSSDIGFSMGGNHLLFSSAAREILYQRKYVQIFVNRSTKDLMMVSAAEPSKNAIKLPESMHLTLARINEAAEKIYRETGRRPTRKQIAEEVGIKEALVTTLLIHQAVQYVPLDTTVGDDGETLLVDRIAGERDSKAAEDAEEIIERHFRELDARERKIITGYYGLMGEPKQTLGELAREFGLARQRISQIRIQAEKKLEANGFFEELKFVGSREE